MMPKMKVRKAAEETPPPFRLHHPLRHVEPTRGIARQRTLAFDHPPRNVARHRTLELRHLVRFGEHRAAVTRVLDETVLPLVAAHLDMGDDVDPQPRRVTPADAAVEQVDVGRDFGEHRIERLVEQFEAGNVGVAQIDDDAGALGCFDARLAHGFLQRLRRPGRFRLGFLASKHDLNFTTARAWEKRKIPVFQGIRWLNGA